MSPYIIHPSTGEPMVSAERAQVSDAAAMAEAMTSVMFRGMLYLSLLEAIEFHEESLSERSLIDELTRALIGMRN